MLKLSFHQTTSEKMMRAVSTLVFGSLTNSGCQVARLSTLASNVQYGFTETASQSDVGPKFVRITDLKAGRISWDAVPHCKCPNPEKYLLQANDLLFARTGATTGKTHLVKDPPFAVFASYLIRVSPKPDVMPEYLYAFFQSDSYWLQILESKEGSAQPNVNGRKLLSINVPVAEPQMQQAVADFLGIVQARQQGDRQPLPALPAPLHKVGRIVSLIEKANRASQLRLQLAAEIDALMPSILSKALRGEL